MNTNVRKLTTMAIMIAVSIVLVTVIHFPLFPGAAFLEYDPADIPILLVTLLFGPLAGLGVTLVAAVIQGFTVSASSGIYGILMHIAATGAYVLAAGLINKKFGKHWQGRAIALAVGCLAMTLVMIPANLIITPMFMGNAVEEVLPMLLPIIIPFNLAKAGINGVCTFILYQMISKYVERNIASYQ